MPTLPADPTLHTLHLRPQQVQMVQAIAQALAANEAIAVEAPTGTGKTYAYLLAALHSGERFVVSTATRALQDQLVLKDLPTVLAHTQLARKVAVLKGRENYVCLHGLAQARTGLYNTSNRQAQPDAGLSGALATVERWAQSTASGDLAELADISQLPLLQPLITASHSRCLGARCAYHDACFSNKARAKAAVADVLVINHHLYFSELRHRQLLGAKNGFVPLANTMVMDEAHQLQAIGLQVLAQGLESADITRYLRAATRHTTAHARGYAPWAPLVAKAEAATSQWRQVHSTATDEAAPAGGALYTSLVQLHNQLSALVAALRAVAGSAAVLEQLADEGDALLHNLRQWAQPAPPGTVRWWARSGGDALGPADDEAVQRSGPRESPLWLWQALANLNAEVQPATWLPAAQGQAADSLAVRRWVFTSATLGQDDDLQWFTEAAGLRMPATPPTTTAPDTLEHAPMAIPAATGLRTVRLPSQFDWARQSAVLVPRGLSRDALGPWLAPHVQALGGRSLVLCTSQAGMVAVASALRQALASSGIAVLVQGEQPKRHLLATMRNTQQTDGAVLVGTMGLWEGVDLPGDALQLVVIDKLPFPPLHDALHAARAHAVDDAGGSGFVDYTVPHTAMLLRQGVGRLIRSAADRGLVVIADDRLLSKNYGPSLLASLPPMRWLAEGEVTDYLAALRRAPDDAALPAGDADSTHMAADPAAATPAADMGNMQ